MAETLTRAGMRLLAKSAEWHGADCGVRWTPSRGCNCGLLVSVLAIEQEARAAAQPDHEPVYYGDSVTPGCCEAHATRAAVPVHLNDDPAAERDDASDWFDAARAAGPLDVEDVFMALTLVMAAPTREQAEIVLRELDPRRG